MAGESPKGGGESPRGGYSSGYGRGSSGGGGGESPKVGGGESPSVGTRRTAPSHTNPRNAQDGIIQALDGERKIITGLQRTLGDSVPEAVEGYLEAVDTYRTSVESIASQGARASQVAKDTVGRQARTLDIFRKSLGEQPAKVSGLVEAIDEYRASVDGYLQSVGRGR